MVRYFTEDIVFKFKAKLLNNKWYKFTAESEIRKLGDVNVIFCSDRYLLDINIKYLHHDYFTDIITFDYSEGKTISGDLFISIDSVRENAAYYKTSFENELNRVLIHGVLHLIGFNDHTKEEKAQMRSKEDYYLNIRNVIAGTR